MAHPPVVDGRISRFLADLKAESGMGRLEQAAGVAAFQLLDDASNVTEQAPAIDGGPLGTPTIQKVTLWRVFS